MNDGQSWKRDAHGFIDRPKQKQPLGRPGKILLLIVLLAVILFGGQTALSYWVDLLWFRSLGYGDVFWTTWRLQCGIFAIFAVATFLILYGAFLALKRAHQADLPSEREIVIARQPVSLSVGIFENLRREIGIGRRKGLLKVRERFPLSLMQSAADLMDQDIATPAVLDRYAQIPFAALAILEPVQQNPEMAPGQSATSCGTISASGQASAKLRMYFKFRELNPSTPGNSAPRSFASRSITFAPQPSTRCRFRMSRPIDQYNKMSSRLTAKAARTWAVRTRVLMSARRSA